MKISGTFDYINRIRSKPPDDGVHMASDVDGWMKGCHSCWFGDMLIPRGCVGFYYRLSDARGIKVFYSLRHRYASKRKYVEKIYKRTKRFYKAGLVPKPHTIRKVDLNLKYKGKKIKTSAYGIVSNHVHYPKKAWEDYAKGVPYDWAAFDHPNHTPKGFLAFVKFAKKSIKAAGFKMDCSYKLGDVVWCTENKRWYLVDVSE